MRVAPSLRLGTLGGRDLEGALEGAGGCFNAQRMSKRVMVDVSDGSCAG